MSNMEQDRIRWDGRYADQPLATPSAPDLLQDHPELLERFPAAGRVLDLACGPGAQSLWLAERGLDVVALDVSPKAIELLNNASVAHGLQDSIEARVHDTEAGIPVDVAGLSAVVCQRYRDLSLYGAFIDRLEVGGLLLLTVLSAVGLDETPGEFHAPAGELSVAFSRDDTKTIMHEEANGQASILVRRIQ
jgi:SAM-dependent methyltransferase